MTLALKLLAGGGRELLEDLSAHVLACLVTILLWGTARVGWAPKTAAVGILFGAPAGAG